MAIRRESDLADDLDHLRDLELVELDQSYRGGTYRIVVPLLAKWIRTTIDIDTTIARAREESQENSL